jgi:hypothetical protein
LEEGTLVGKLIEIDIFGDREYEKGNGSNWIRIYAFGCVSF